jgi:hypothetical protein
VPDPDAWLLAAARLDAAAGRLGTVLDAVTVGPTDWSGTSADQFRAQLDHQRRQLAGVADALRRQATLARVAAAQLPPAPSAHLPPPS